MNGIRITTVGIFISLFLIGCGHTNNLAQYDLAGKKVLFRSFSSTTGSSSTIVESPDNESIVADIAAIIGSTILSDKAKKKLERAIDTDTIAMNVSHGAYQAISDYLPLVEVKSMSDDPDFLVETDLTTFRLKSSSAGLTARVCANTRMVDRRSGGIVWENSEAHTVNISNTIPAIFGPDVIRSGTSVFNAVQLLNMEEEQIRKVINAAAEQAGREIGETMREDVAEAHGR